MVEINLIGGGFHHVESSVFLNNNKYVKWLKNSTESDITMYVDHGIYVGVNDSSNKKKYAWLAESSWIASDVFHFIMNNYELISDKFEYLFTYDQRLLQLGDKIKFVRADTSPWIQNRQVYPKSLLASMIFSNKVYAPGHKKRWEVYNANTQNPNIKFLCGTLPSTYIDENGNIESGKMYGLKDYMFSISIENDKYNSFISEKATDCFATGTIPVYWGADDIVEYYNKDGIIFLTDDFDLNSLTPELYYSKIDAVKDNYERVLQCMNPEDFIYLNYLK